MNDALLRRGSIELVAALALVAFVAGRVRKDAFVGSSTGPPIHVVATMYSHADRIREIDGFTPLLLGRAHDCDVVLSADSDASRYHARLEGDDSMLFLRDLESTNGTFLNGTPVRGSIEVRDGDEIDLGVTRLRIERIGRTT